MLSLLEKVTREQSLIANNIGDPLSNGREAGKELKIAFDHTIFSCQKYGGVSRYFCSLASSLQRLGISPRIFAGFHRNRYLAEAAHLDAAGWAMPGYPVHTARLFLAISRTIAQRGIRRWKPDLLHRTFYDAPLVGRKVPNVITVYDMIDEKFPSPARRNGAITAKRKAVDDADHIVAISHHTSRDLQELWGVDSARITVTHLAPDGTGSKDALESIEPLPTFPYLLFVSARGGYKNFDGLLRAMSASPRLGKAFGLVALGGSPFSREERRRIIDAGLSPDRVLHVVGDDSLLAALYRNAAALVYPSLYEGFGLPPLEAMLHDCPVCVSKTSSLPEVVGNAGEYLDPTDPESIADAIERVVYSPSRRQQLIEAGRVQSRHFSWEKCARETLAVYRRLIA